MATNLSWIGDYPSTDIPGMWMNTTYTPVVHPVMEYNIAFDKFRRFLEFYVIPIVVAVGLIGNALSIAVFMGSYLNRYSSNVYLSALAITDSVFLLCLLFNWSSNVGSELYSLQGWCQVLTYLTYITSFLSVWYVVAFSLERYIAVCYPLKRQEMCTARRAKIVVVSGALFSMLFYSFSLFMMGIYPMANRMICLGDPKHYYALTMLTNIDTVITFAIPVILIIGCNVRITYMVFWFYRERAYMVQGQPRSAQRSRKRSMTPSRTGSLPANSSRSPTSTASQLKVTKMLLIVSTVFLLCNLPAHSTKTYLTIRQHLDPQFQFSKNFNNLVRVFQLVYYSNFSVNFFLYSISGSTFRKALCRLLRKSCTNARAMICRRSDDDVTMLSAWNRKSKTMITGRGQALIYDHSPVDQQSKNSDKMELNKLDCNGIVQERISSR